MDIVAYKCPSCGAGLTFSPEMQKLSCEYCGSSFSVEEMKQRYAQAEKVLDGQKSKAAAEEKEFAEHTRVYRCTSCGAEILAEENQTALSCCYCHSPVVLSGKMKGRFRPQKVIGFQISKEQAVEIFKSELLNLFSPKDLKAALNLEKVTGLYVPFWLLGCTATAAYTASGTTSSSHTSGSYDITETKHYRLLRRGEIEMANLPADGSRKIDDELMECLEPFDYKQMKDFSLSYLSGFYAENFDMDKNAMRPRLKQRIENLCKKEITGTVSGFSVSGEKLDCTLSDENWTYALFPVWFLSYRYGNETYEFIINGQTGKITGSKPPLIESKRSLFFCGGLFAACAAAVYALFGFLLGGVFF